MTRIFPKREPVIYVLSGVIGPEQESIVLGAYSTTDKVVEAIKKFEKNDSKLRHYYYDTKKLDDDAEWNNQQMAVSF